MKSKYDKKHLKCLLLEPKAKVYMYLEGVAWVEPVAIANAFGPVPFPFQCMKP
jgi:hypothetical protein